MGLADKELERTNSKLITKVNLNTPSNEPDTIITLSTNYGIANFKRLMEELLLPIVKNKSNIISESLAVRTVNNILGIRGSSIESTFPLSDISTPYSLALSKRLLKAFNDLDIVETKDHIVKNANNVPLK